IAGRVLTIAAVTAVTRNPSRQRTVAALVARGAIGAAITGRAAGPTGPDRTGIATGTAVTAIGGCGVAVGAVTADAALTGIPAATAVTAVTADAGLAEDERRPAGIPTGAADPAGPAGP